MNIDQDAEGFGASHLRLAAQRRFIVQVRGHPDSMRVSFSPHHHSFRGGSHPFPGLRSCNAMNGTRFSKVTFCLLRFLRTLTPWESANETSAKSRINCLPSPKARRSHAWSISWTFLPVNRPSTRSLTAELVESTTVILSILKAVNSPGCESNLDSTTGPSTAASTAYGEDLANWFCLWRRPRAILSVKSTNYDCGPYP